MTNVENWKFTIKVTSNTDNYPFGVTCLLCDFRYSSTSTKQYDLVTLNFYIQMDSKFESFEKENNKKKKQPWTFTRVMLWLWAFVVISIVIAITWNMIAYSY